MKGIILAGGSGTRLHPLTKITSKQLLPIYNQPMIMYPISTLLRAGITDILVIVAPERAGDFLNLLGSGKELGAWISYEVQEKPEGLAQAFVIAEDFIGSDTVAMILGDNIFTDDFSDSIQSFKQGALAFAKEIDDPERFGVMEFKDGKVISIEEKPEKPKSKFAQTGLYVFDNSVVAKAKALKPSKRGELEITDLNNVYLKEGKLRAEIVKGEWIDAGTFESLHRASLIAREHHLVQTEQWKVNIKSVSEKKNAKMQS